MASEKQTKKVDETTEVNGEVLTKENKDAPMSQDEMETLEVFKLGEIDSISGGDLTSPDPINVEGVDIVKKSTTQKISTGELSEITAGGPEKTTFDTVSTDDAVTNESLNRTAKTLSVSIDDVMSKYASNFTKASNFTIHQVKDALNKIVTTTNQGFSNVKVQADDQMVEIDNKIDSVVDDVNKAFGVVREKNKQQNHDIATKINVVSGQNNTNVLRLEKALRAMDKKIKAIDDVYLTDSDMAERITSVNNIVETLRGSDLDVVKTLAGLNTELNSLTRLEVKEVNMSATSGVYNFNLAAEGFREMKDEKDYTIEAEVVGNTAARVSVTNKSKDGADLVVKSCGVHFVPQPVDGSVHNVVLLVKVTHNKVNPLTFDIDTLDDSWLTDGNGTDSNKIK